MQTTEPDAVLGFAHHARRAAEIPPEPLPHGIPAGRANGGTSAEDTAGRRAW